MTHLRVFEGGIEQFSDEKLLSLIIDSKQSAKELLISYADIHDLAVREEQELCMVKGIGKQKARRLYAVFELYRRLSSYPLSPGLKISDPEVVFQHFGPLMSHLKKEIFIILPLNTTNKLIRPVKISEGILNSALVHPREVFRPAILECAASIVLVHNHPSGEVKPSVEDRKITQRLAEAGKLMDIPVLDHIIIGQNKYFSFREDGLVIE